MFSETSGRTRTRRLAQGNPSPDASSANSVRLGIRSSWNPPVQKRIRLFRFVLFYLLPSKNAIWPSIFRRAPSKMHSSVKMRCKNALASKNVFEIASTPNIPSRITPRVAGGRRKGGERHRLRSYEESNKGSERSALHRPPVLRIRSGIKATNRARVATSRSGMTVQERLYCWAIDILTHSATEPKPHS